VGAKIRRQIADAQPAVRIARARARRRQGRDGVAEGGAEGAMLGEQIARARSGS
jgi:hypothetical protein